MDEYLQFDWQTFFDTVGTNPFQAMWFFFSHGGWVIFIAVFLWAIVIGWVNWKQNIFNSKKQWVLLAIQVPRLHEQTPRAVDNMFAYLAGAHSANSWTEDWIIGRTQDTISIEIASIDGNVQFFIRTTRALRDLVEAAIYSQYPDAEIAEVEDYTLKVPQHYPDEEWDLWGTQFIPVKSDVFPLKTYPYFEDKVSGEFKDPLAAMLESLSRLHPGEQAWFQIVLTPIPQKEFQKKAESMVKKLAGQKVTPKKSLLEHAADLPLTAMSAIAQEVMGGGGDGKPVKKETNPLLSKLLHMTEGEKIVVAGVEEKLSKIVYLAKMRFIYVGKKEIMTKSRIAYSFIGSIKQFNTNNMLSVKPDFKSIGISGALWFFKKTRNNERKNRLLMAYRNRSNWSGLPNFHLCTEELATLWHFPITMQSKPPQLKKTESKRSEPPANIPFG